MFSFGWVEVGPVEETWAEPAFYAWRVSAVISITLTLVLRGIFSSLLSLILCSWGGGASLGAGRKCVCFRAQGDASGALNFLCFRQI